MCAYLACRYVTTSKLGRILISIRDAESRTRFMGYRVEYYKLFVFVMSAMLAGVAGALFVPQVGIINPGEFSPINSIEIVIWVALGGRGTLVGAALGAILISLANSTKDIKHLQRVIDYGIPLVLFDKITKLIKCSRVIINDIRASYDVVTHLINNTCS